MCHQSSTLCIVYHTRHWTGKDTMHSTLSSIAVGATNLLIMDQKWPCVTYCITPIQCHDRVVALQQRSWALFVGHSFSCVPVPVFIYDIQDKTPSSYVQWIHTIMSPLIYPTLQVVSSPLKLEGLNEVRRPLPSWPSYHALAVAVAGEAGERLYCNSRHTIKHGTQCKCKGNCPYTIDSIWEPHDT